MRNFKYFVTRVGNMIVIRRTLKGLTRITSSLTKAENGLKLVQTTYTGGIVVGTMPYNDWCQRVGKAITTNGYLKIDKELYMGLRPFITKGAR